MEEWLEEMRKHDEALGEPLTYEEWFKRFEDRYTEHLEEEKERF